MWLPTSIYERLPHAWLLLGLVFMSSGLYLGFDYAWSLFYYVVGVVCCLKSLWIFSVRLAARKPAETPAPGGDETTPADDVGDAEPSA